MAHEDLGLGNLITEPRHRDAVHVAVAPVVAGVELTPGMHVGLIGDDLETVGPDAERHVGVVDPFLTAPVQPGERCWLLVYPGTITYLRHTWSHPAFRRHLPARAT